jgi:hypothetical protein
MKIPNSTELRKMKKEVSGKIKKYIEKNGVQPTAKKTGFCRNAFYRTINMEKASVELMVKIWDEIKMIDKNTVL